MKFNTIQLTILHQPRNSVKLQNYPYLSPGGFILEVLNENERYQTINANSFVNINNNNAPFVSIKRHKKGLYIT